MLKNQLLKLAQYNLWANAKLLDWMIKAGEDLADANCESSFPSLRKTVYHIYDAEYAWIFRLTNQELLYWPPSRDFNFTMMEFAEVLKSQSQKLIDFVSQLDEQQLGDFIQYPNVKGVLFSNTIADIINHVINHGTYHRGQLITMMRTLGYTDLGATDYIAYCRL